MSKNPPQNSLTEFQKQNWNASIFALMAMGAVGVKVNPPKKNPDNRQIQKPREQNSVENPPMNNSLTPSQAQNWNASRLVLMQMGVVVAEVNPSKKNPDNRQIPKPEGQNSVDWRLSGLITNQEVPVNPVTAVGIKMVDEKPSTTPSPAQDMRGIVGQVPTTVAGMRALVDELNNERTGSNSR